MLTAARAIVIAVLMAVTAVSCGHSVAHDTLERAEALIDEHEDSALMLLQTIDPASVGNGDDRALYDMLMAQALDKNHMPLPPDSLIEAAARRFIVKGDRPKGHAGRLLPRTCEIPQRESPGCYGDVFPGRIDCRGT